jgi:protein phosphatase
MIRLEAAALTDTGRERKENEDRVWTQVYAPSEGEAVGLFIVCDGIGGHLGGEYASHWAVEAVKQQLADLFCISDPRGTVKLSKEELEAYLNSDDATRRSVVRKLENQVREAVLKANKVVYEYAVMKPRQAGDAGTTITLALVQGSRSVIANVGDSRTYLLRDRRLQQITKDHSLVASMVASGQIQPEEIYHHPQRNMIYRSLGLKNDVQVDTFWQVLQPGDCLLLCSDGLWEMVQDEGEIARLIEDARSPSAACQHLVDAANAAGGNDNIGVVVVRIT